MYTNYLISFWLSVTKHEVIEYILKCNFFSQNHYCYHYHHNHLDTHLTKEMKTVEGFRTEDTDDVAGSVKGSVLALPPLLLHDFFLSP